MSTIQTLQTISICVAIPPVTPIYPGIISTLGRGGDKAMTYDRAENAIYFFETETSSAGRVMKLQ